MHIFARLVSKNMNTRIKHNLNESYLNSLTEAQRDKEMSEWNVYEWEQYYCPNGTITLNELKNALINKCVEMIEEKYGCDFLK